MEKNIKQLIGYNEIQKRLEELAKQIDKDYNNEEITVICRNINFISYRILTLICTVNFQALFYKQFIIVFV